MRSSVLGFAVFGLALAAACSSKGSPASNGTSAGDDSGSSGTASSSAFPAPGNPDGSCKTLPAPSQMSLADTSSPTTVVGTGTAASCTFDALNAAVTKGGIITFDCGSEPVTIPVASTLQPPVSKGSASPIKIVIDGGGKVTLDGQGSVRIMSWVHDTWRMNTDTLTLQRIHVINGKMTPTETIPPCPAANGISNTECSTGYDDGQGGALYMQDGELVVIDSVFEKNQAALLGPDTGGGAIYIFGSASPAYVMQSSFLDNTASNAGAFGMLGSGAIASRSSPRV